MNSRPSVKTLKNGPLILKNLAGRFFGPSGEKIDGGESIPVCRCGKTGRKPFCDNSHSASEFRSGRLSGRNKDRVVDYPGCGITVNDNRGVCSHDGSCFRELPEVFRPSRWRWINPRGAPAEKIIETVRKCPSGALSYTVEGRRFRDLEGRAPSAKLDGRGPLNMEGCVELDDCEGALPESGEHYSLCTCGRSKNKPFCDGSHAPGIFVYEEAGPDTSP